MPTRIEAQGLNELKRALARGAPELRKAMTVEMREIARIGSDEAKRIAEAKGLHLSGDLIKGIKPGVQGTTAMIRSTAKHRGFYYPVRYEFGDRKRPFLIPAVEAKFGEFMDRLEQLMDRICARVEGDSF